MKLWRVTFEGECYVRADTWIDAERIARDAVEDDSDGAGLETDSEPVRKGDSIPDHWRNVIPYHELPEGDETADLTVANLTIPINATDTVTKDLFEEVKP